MLTPYTLAPYLEARGLIDQRSAVDGRLQIVDATRRNYNFKVVCDDRAYIVKQGVGPGRAATIRNEAAVYRLLSAGPPRSTGSASKAFGRYIPVYLLFDAEHDLLVLELLESAVDLRAYHVRLGRFPRGVAVQLGEALAALHRSGIPRAGQDGEGEHRDGNEGDLVAQLSHAAPGVLSSHRPRLAAYGHISGTNLQIVRILQRFPEFGELLDSLREEWRTTALIHGDIKWSNCLLVPPAAGRRGERNKQPRDGANSRRGAELKLVDWELASIGDPCWDVGSVFNDYLCFWLLSVPVTGQELSEEALEMARYPLDKMQPAIQAFWAAYTGRMGLDAATADKWLERSVQFAAARLLQTAFEQMQMATQLTGNVVFFLQVSLNMLQRPLEAAISLLGISPRYD
jgi:hypothetical protein